MLRQAVVPPLEAAVVPLARSSGSTAACCSSRFGRKSGPKILDSGGSLANLRLGICGEVDQHLRQQIHGQKPQKTQQIRRSKFELFFGVFFEKKIGRNWWGWSEIRGNQGLLIPLDVDLSTFVGPIFTNSWGFVRDMGEGGYKLTHTHKSVAPLGMIHLINKTCKG